MAKINIFTETGSTLPEVEDKIRQKYGDRAEIISQHQREIGGFLGVGARRQWEVQVLVKAAVQPNAASERSSSSGTRQSSARNDLIEAARIMQNAKKEVELADLVKGLQEDMRDLRLHIKQGAGRAATMAEEPSHPALARLRASFIEDNDFNAALTDEIIASIKKDFSLSELEDYAWVEETALKELANRLSFYRPAPRGKPRIFVLVGPTGVGKTTTIAKIAAMTRLNDPSLDLRLINLDTYKTGAMEQIEIYAENIGAPVNTIWSAEDLKQEIELAKEADLIIIDTVGKSPREPIKLAEMQMMLEACGRNAEVHLAISATTKESDVRDILAQFELFRYRSVIVTKMDETSKIGSLITPVIERRTPISYLTTGQLPTPANIKKGSVARIWERLMGFNDDKLAEMIEHADEDEGF